MKDPLKKKGNLNWVITELRPLMRTLEPLRAAEKQVNHFKFSTSPVDENPNRLSPAKLHGQGMLFLYAIIYRKGL